MINVDAINDTVAIANPAPTPSVVVSSLMFMSRLNCFRIMIPFPAGKNQHTVRGLPVSHCTTTFTPIPSYLSATIFNLARSFPFSRDLFRAHMADIKAPGAIAD